MGSRKINVREVYCWERHGTQWGMFQQAMEGIPEGKLTRPGKRLHFANWKITMLLIGKSTISMGHLKNSYFDITRGYTIIYPNKSHYINPIKSH